MANDYGSLINCAMPGVIGNTGDYNIDGACYVESGVNFVVCGKIAGIKFIDGYKQVSNIFNDNYDIPYGIVLRSQYATVTDEYGYSAYEEGDAISVLSHGCGWVLSENIDSAPRWGEPVHVARDGCASKGGVQVPGWYYTGGWTRWDERYYIVEVCVKQNSAHSYEEFGKPVNGAEMTANLESPQPYDKLVQFTISTSPEDATNPEGTWHVSNPDAVEIMAHTNNGKTVVVQGKNNFIGRFHVIWTANDGSGVQASMEFEFTRL